MLFNDRFSCEAKVVALLLDSAFVIDILSETGVKLTFEFGLRSIPVPAINLSL